MVGNFAAKPQKSDAGSIVVHAGCARLVSKKTAGAATKAAQINMANVIYYSDAKSLN